MRTSSKRPYNVGLFQVFELGLLEIKCHIIDSLAYAGGQCIELYPDKPIYDIPAVPVCTGKELTDNLLKQIEPFGATFHLGQEVTTVEKQEDGRFFVMYHWHGSSGGGAVKGRDGFQCIGLMISLGGLTLPNVEGYEQAYPVRILRQELRTDTAGAGQFRGIYLQGNEHARELLTAWMEPFRDLGLTVVSNQSVGSTDHVAFDEVGLPGFQFLQDHIPGTGGHTNMDFYDAIQPEDLMKNAVIMASYAYHAAMSDERVPRKTPAK